MEKQKKNCVAASEREEFQTKHPTGEGWRRRRNELRNGMGCNEKRGAFLSGHTSKRWALAQRNIGPTILLVSPPYLHVHNGLYGYRIHSRAQERNDALRLQPSG